MSQKQTESYLPAKIYLDGKKRVSMKTVKVSDYFFVDPPGRQGSVHCIVSSIEKRKRKITIHFAEAGNRPDGFTGNNRQKDITRISFYPQK